LSAVKFVKLADDTMRDLDVAPDGRWAVGRDTRGYISDYKRAAADIYRVNTTTGERTLMLKNQLINTSTGNHTYGISPDGHYFLYWKGQQYQATISTRPPRARLRGDAASFTDLEFDHPGPGPRMASPVHERRQSVIVDHRYDLWQLPLDARPPVTSRTAWAARRRSGSAMFGSSHSIRRPSSLDPGHWRWRRRGGGASARATIDLAKPVTLSAYGEYTKKAGFYELAGGQLKEIVYDDASFSTPVKAAKADKFLFTRQTFVEFPDLRVWARTSETRPRSPTPISAG